MKKYEYKNSGIEWLGDIPKHWKRDKLFRLAENVGSGGTPKSSNESYYGGEIVWIQSGDLTDSFVSETSKTITQEGLSNSSAKIFPKGTLLVAMYGATIGKLGIMEMDAAINQACCAIQFSKKIHSKFSYYLFLDMRNFLITQSYGGGQPNISQEIIKQRYLFYPMLAEQKAIAEYLDRTCEKIDRIISIKENQLEKIEDYYFSKMKDVFLKSNSNEVKKDSGVSFLGVIPAKWNVKKVKRICSVIYGDNLPEEKRDDGEFNVFGSNGIVGKHSIANTNGETIIIGRKGSAGELKYNDDSCFVIDTAFYIDTTKTNCSLKWLFYALNLLNLKNLDNESPIPGLARNQILHKLIPVPPIDEQIEIANQIENVENRLNELLYKIKQQIETLKTYRKSLIHECVTGKKQIYEGEYAEARTK